MARLTDDGPGADKSEASGRPEVHSVLVVTLIGAILLLVLLSIVVTTWRLRRRLMTSELKQISTTAGLISPQLELFRLDRQRERVRQEGAAPKLGRAAFRGWRTRGHRA